MTSPVTQSNLLSVMDNLFAIDKDWATVYGKIKLQLHEPVNKNNFSITYSSLAPLFCYELMSRRVSIEQFKRVINFIYHSSDENILSLFFSSFFSSDPNKIPLQNFCISKRKNQNLSIEQIIKYSFLDIKNNLPCLYKKNIKYLDVILEEVSLKERKSLYQGSFEIFLSMVINEDESFSHLINIANKNYYFFTNGLVKSKNFTTTCLNLLHYGMLKDNLEKALASYQVLKRKTTQFNDKLKESLISFNNENSNELFVNNRILAICLEAQEDVFSIVNNRYLIEFKQLKDDNYTPTDYDFYYGSYFRDIYPSLMINNYIKFDWTFFDTKKSAYENAIYIHVFENNLKHGYESLLPHEVKNYLIEFCDNFDNHENSFKNVIDFKLLRKFCNYSALNEVLISNEQVIKKIKI